MKKTYKISVIVPVYNAEKYLEKCIKSIINQTMQDIEIIIVNDGSTDGSLKIAEELAKKKDNIKVISRKNQGAIVARIEGYKIASGKYIAFVDDDDFLEKNMYEKLYKIAKKEDADIAICNYKFYPKKIRNKRKWFNEYKGVVDEKFVKRNNLLWNKIVKKSYLNEIDIVNLFQKLGESAYTMALIQTDKIITTNEELYNYRVGQQSLSSNYKNINWHVTCAQKSITKLEMIKNTKFEEKWLDFFQYGVFFNMFKVLLVAGYNNDKKLYLKYKKSIQNYNNKYCKNNFQSEYGKLKTFVVFNFILKSYLFTKIMSKIIM